MTIDQLLREKSAEIRQIAARHGAYNVRVFGSVVSGEAGYESNLDLLITLDPGRSLLDIIAIKQDIEDVVGCSVDVVTEAAISPYIRERVLQEATPL